MSNSVQDVVVEAIRKAVRGFDADHRRDIPLTLIERAARDASASLSLPRNITAASASGSKVTVWVDGVSRHDVWYPPDLFDSVGDDNPAATSRREEYARRASYVFDCSVPAEFVDESRPLDAGASLLADPKNPTNLPATPFELVVRASEWADSLGKPPHAVVAFLPESQFRIVAREVAASLGRPVPHGLACLRVPMFSGGVLVVRRSQGYTGPIAALMDGA